MRLSDPQRVPADDASNRASNHTHVRLWLLELETQLLRLERDACRGWINQLESDLDRCNAMLSGIVDMLEIDGALLTPFCRALVELRLRLIDMRARLEARRKVWWRRLLQSFRDGNANS
jgi:hypothetical protein